MPRDDLLDRLRAHQEGVLAIMRGAEAMLTDPMLRDVPALARSRWAVMRALAAYQQFKHHEIFDPAIAGRMLGGDRAQRMKDACIAMDNEFRDYVTKWSSTDVAGAWAVYQPAALRIIARLREHIARERHEIGALLALVA